MLGYAIDRDFSHKRRAIGGAASRHLRYALAMPSPHLDRKLKESLGNDAGEELASMIDRIDPIRGDIAELRHAMEKEFSAQRFDIEKALREQTRFFFVAWAVLLAAVVGLYGTVVAMVR